MDTYTVEVTRDDGLWSAVVRGLPPNTSAGYDVEHLAELHDDVRESLVDLLGTEDFTLVWKYRTDDGDFTAPLLDALDKSARAGEARAELDRARLEAIAAMRAAGLSYRDIGDALEMSHQRVAQLNGSARKAS
ncbi:MerR family transcriptional regulator [Pseudonocardia phyllosphaerae]|uniref:MerR n=1 Tax=Pseudonocardia phyllosphaerae TaxID=3390502 RepID=UPI00397A62EF